MNEGVEAAAALTTATLAAGELERGGRIGASMHGGAAADCLNCGAALHGPFCQACGQSAHVHRSLLHLIEEALHGLFHFEAKGWRTLPLLVARPGLLTRRYVEGRRVRYVSPLALFLFCVFVLFFAASLLGDATMAASPKALAELRESVAEARAELGGIESRLADASLTPAARAEAQEQGVQARRTVATLETALRAVERAASAARPAAAGSAAAAAASEPEAFVVGPFVVTQPRPEKGGRLREAVRRALADPAFTLYRMKSSAYKFAFLFVPVSLPFVWLVFCRRRDVGLYDHAVFVLYSLSFMSLLFVALMALAAAGLDEAATLGATFLPPLHIGWQLQEAYRLGLWSTIWRAALLSVVAAAVLLLYALFVAWLTIA